MENATEIVPTRASILKNQSQIEVVVHTKRRKTTSSTTKSEAKVNETESEFNVKQATKDIIRMGTKGFYKFKREKTLKGLAVELGAKPEKKRYHNYKQLKEIRRVQKERRDQRFKESGSLSSLNNFNKKYAKKKQKKNDFDILNSYGKAK